MGPENANVFSGTALSAVYCSVLILYFRFLKERLRFSSTLNFVRQKICETKRTADDTYRVYVCVRHLEKRKVDQREV